MGNFFSKLFKKDKDKNENEELMIEGEEQYSDEEIEAMLLNDTEIEVQEEALEAEQEDVVESDATTESRNQADEELPFEEEDEEMEAGEQKASFFQKLKDGLFKTRKNITEKINDVLAGFRAIDEDLFDELEEILITADVGVETTMNILEDLKLKIKQQNIKDPMEIKGLLKQEISELLGEQTEMVGQHSPEVILIIGVNGVGKTTSIGKISARLKRSGKKVLIAAADTFRAAAIDQLEVWGKRSGVDVIKHQEGADPAAVIFDAINAAKSRKTDVLICDTAGRLHNKKNLMEELKKIFRVIEREYPEAHKEVLLVLDATTGQNAVSQAKLFKEVANITGIILTKLDGTAKGGIVISIKSELGVPVKLVGVGEKINDMQDFIPKDFVEALFSE
ncbi:MAG: signal recognition particle-docking protein FtsY [Bacillota bacterium]